MHRYRRHLCLAAFCTVAAAQSPRAEPWNRFRGPNGSGVSADTGFPVTFGGGKNQLWRTPARPGKSSPVLTSRHIFLTAYQDGKLFTQCFDRKSGQLLWERFLEKPRAEIANRLNHEAAMTPVTDGENVYAFFKDYGLVSYDAAGKLRWKTPLGPFNNTQGLSACPILAGDSVVVDVDQWEGSYILGVNRANGEIRWKTPREEGEGWGTPLLYEPPGGDAAIVTISRGLLGMHRASDGKRTLTLQGMATTIVGSPVLEGDVVYSFGYGSETPVPFAPRLQQRDKNGDGKLAPDEYGADPILNNMGRNAGNRDGIVSEDEWNIFAQKAMGPNRLAAVRLGRDGARELWRYDKNFTGVIPTVLAYQGTLYIMRNGGILTTHDAGSGQVVKAARIEGALGGYSSSPVAAEGKVWIASEEGKVSVVRAGGEWEVLAVNDLGEGCYATPALSGGILYLRTAEALYAFASERTH